MKYGDYSEDLLKNITEAVGRGMKRSEAANPFGVSLSSIKRYARMISSIFNSGQGLPT
jgi:transposase